MILITGAAGKTGRAIIRALAQSGESVRALVRRSDRVAHLEALGVEETLAGDLLDPARVIQAVEGVRAVYHIAPNVHPDEAAIGRILLDAAKSANVEHFVFHSVLRPQVEAMPHHWQKLRVEEMIFESGLPFTILQPTIYMQNLLANWNQIARDGIYSVPYSAETRLSMVDLEDVAQVAAKVLTQPGHHGAVYELVGVTAISQTEVAKILGDQLHRPVTVRVVPLDEWERNARASGLGEYQVTTLLKMFRYYERFGFASNPNVLSLLLQREPTSFAGFVNRIANERENDSRTD